MVNYQHGKIYKIVCNVTGKVYIGSTTMKYLSQRLVKHLADYERFKNGKRSYITSFETLKNGDYDIVLIETFPCNSKDELFARERHWTNNVECVNKIKNQGKFLELGEREYNKDYRINNIDSIKLNKKKYYLDNKDVIADKHRTYANENKEKLFEYKQKYREENKEKIKLKKRAEYLKNKDVILERQKANYETKKHDIAIKSKEPFICECGSTCTIGHKLRHVKSEKHQNYIKGLEQ